MDKCLVIDKCSMMEVSKSNKKKTSLKNSTN
jgi:hypothetical protein